MTFAEQLYKARNKKQWNKTECAYRLKVARSSYMAWENGHVPSLKKAKEISHKMGFLLDACSMDGTNSLAWNDTVKRLKDRMKHHKKMAEVCRTKLLDLGVDA